MNVGSWWHTKTHGHRKAVHADTGAVFELCYSKLPWRPTVEVWFTPWPGAQVEVSWVRSRAEIGPVSDALATRIADLQVES